MNTEELEKSLRAEFEGQMLTALGKMRSDVAELQRSYESEFEKHRSQMDDAFRALSERLDAPVEFDPAFNESVVEHLRLARDEGAEITAMAMGEAEKLSSNNGNHDVENVRNAISQIKENSTQASILRALVDSAANFAPRGSFFIVKNEHLVGWKAFGKGELPDENDVRGIHFPVASDTLASDAVRSLSNVRGAYSDNSENSKFIGPLSFGTPNNMFAFPLCARGRGVAVLYVDGGEADERVNVEALETLVTVAGLRIELLANVMIPTPEKPVEEAVSEPAPALAPVEQYVPAEPVEEPVAAEVEEIPEAAIETPVEEVSYEPAPEAAVETPVEDVSYEPVPEAFVADVPAEQTVEEEIPEAVAPVQESEVEYTGNVDVSHNGSAPEAFEIERSGTESFEVPEAPVQESAIPEFSSNNFTDEVPAAEPEAFQEPEVVEPVVAAVEVDPVPQTVKSYRERSVDLPIEVSEEERRPHSDARRFARLLVSEIRLYNEQKVIEGRQTGDIYEQLRDAIDRSREMYEKRVQPDVAAKFDYFHYELVNSLAEGDEEKLGAGYMAVKA